MKKVLLVMSLLVACFLLLDSRNLFTTIRASSSSKTPAATTVTLGGRIQNAEGRGVYRATVTLTDGNNNFVTSLSNPFGYYRFYEVEAGLTYTVSVTGKGLRFTPQMINVAGDNLDINFTAQ